jgi:hypothetical protein
MNDSAASLWLAADSDARMHRCEDRTVAPFTAGIRRECWAHVGVGAGLGLGLESFRTYPFRRVLPTFYGYSRKR